VEHVTTIFINQIRQNQAWREVYEENRKHLI